MTRSAAPHTDPALQLSGAGRAAATITALTAVSRITGFVRVLVVTAVLGDTFLGDVYQSTNALPTALFELVAAGALAAVLVPSLVACAPAGIRAAERLAGQVLGAVLAALAVLAVLTALASPLVARILTAGIDDAAVQADARALAVFFLVAFAPQLVCYGAGLVATGALHARHHFAAPAIAPAVNNVIVVVAYLVFDRMRNGQPPSLDLSGPERLVLAGGTTLAVVAFCAVPVVALAASGFRLRPLTPRQPDPALRTLAGRGAWATVQVGATQLLVVAVLVLANGPGGQVVAYSFAFTLFLLPFALIATPVATALYPRLAAVSGGAFAARWTQGLVATVVLLAPAAAALVALSTATVRLCLSGAVDQPAAIASAVRFFGVGLLGYGVYLFMTRAWFARGDTRTPALVNLAVAGAGIVAMVLAAAVAPDDERAAALAAAHSAVWSVGAWVLVRRLRQGRGHDGGRPLAGPVIAALGAGALAAVVMAATAAVVPGEGRLGAASDLALGGCLGVAVYLALLRWWAGPLRPLVALEPVGVQ